MRIVIDLQGVQGSNRLRGIGRYTLSFAEAIVQQRGHHEVFLALNGNFPNSIEPIRAKFDGLLAQENIGVWQAPGPVCSSSIGNEWRRRCAELIRENFLAGFEPDIIVISSLFEGLIDDTVTSIGTLSKAIPTAVVLYDLIPLIFRDPYLNDPTTATWYENKLDHLRRADLLLAISESSKQEAIRYLGVPSANVTNVSSAAESHFKPRIPDADVAAKLRERYGLRRPFVMYTGGIDHRKNIEGLIRAFALLPAHVRISHQLAIICSVESPSRSALEALAKQHGLENNQFVLTGFVPEADLLTLYNLCKVFVFPSFHEGFGLPALEAMACGRAVIGSTTSSVPEVVGRSDALFDPRDDESIAEKLLLVLTDDQFRSELEVHGLQQARRFSWADTAKRTIAAFEAANASRKPMRSRPARRPKLAYVSPLAPERSGISDYSAELLPELSRHYEIDVIVAQDFVSDPWVKANCHIRTATWFRAHADLYARVLYHFGNSTFHAHMFGLLQDVPGVVVLHDFYLGGVVSHMEAAGYQPNYWAKALYQSHGYVAAHHRFSMPETDAVVWHYPSNLGVVKSALGIIVHSDNSCRLARRWYGESGSYKWAVVPHLRVPAYDFDRASARSQLNFRASDFVVCSFGLLGPTKLNHRLLNAWLTSALAKDGNCVLIFVGAPHGDTYSDELINSIAHSESAGRIRITGWAEGAQFRQYLMAADLGVQLRARSRGETSGTVLDCMNYGLPVVVNAHGSVADLPGDGVWRLPDEFVDAELVEALETLWADPSRRRQLGAAAREIVLLRHSPRACADQYADAIETTYDESSSSLSALAHAIARIDSPPAQPKAWLELAESMAVSAMDPGPPQLFVDVSELVQRDSKSGMQRVVHSILKEWLIRPPAGFRVEPVYASSDRSLGEGYQYARTFTSDLLGWPQTILADGPIDVQPGDQFVGLDLAPHVVLAQRAYYKKLRNFGVRVDFIVYDMLPLLLPQTFQAGAAELHRSWLEVVTENDGAICISRAVARELAAWVDVEGPKRLRPFKIDWFHLGANIEASAFSRGMPSDAMSVIGRLAKRPCFLLLGTLEPRKGHAQVLGAFENLWRDKVETNLVFVGKKGWMTEALVDRLNNHPQFGERLFWLDGISDEYLERIYEVTTCLILASEGEGFGLPLIEAAKHNLKIIARDIPVFREVAGEHAFYFKGVDSLALSTAIYEWMALDAKGSAPKSDDMPHLTWRESAEQLFQKICVLSEAQAAPPNLLLANNEDRHTKDVVLRLPCGNELVISGESSDLSVIGAIETLEGRYEPHVMSAMELLIKPDFICLDIGANIGVMALEMASAASKGHVYAFEPSPTNYKNLRKNISQNLVSNITPIPFGVGDEAATLEFNYVPHVSGCSFISSTGVREGLQEQVQIVTVDSVVEKKALSTVDFIKLDVEGGERKALLGSLETLKRFRPITIMEFNPDPIRRFYGEDPYDLYALLKEIYANIYLIEDQRCQFRRINSYEMLQSRVSNGKGWEDLLCTGVTLV